MKIAICPMNFGSYREKLYGDLCLNNNVILYTDQSYKDQNIKAKKTNGFSLLNFFIEPQLIKDLLLGKNEKYVFQFNPSQIAMVIAVLLKPLLKCQIYLFGIGYGKTKFANIARNFAAKRADGLLLYSKRDEKLLRRKNSNITVLNNTLYMPCFNKDLKYGKNILFVGTLKKRKGIKELFQIFNIVHNQDPSIGMIIVGDGPEINKVKKLSKEYRESVELKGRITAPRKLKDIYENSFCMVSPKQAGLSILQSFAFATPVVTLKGAISGGEILAINNKKNGLIAKNVQEAAEWILQLLEDPNHHKVIKNNTLETYLDKYSYNHFYSKYESMIQ